MSLVQLGGRGPKALLAWSGGKGAAWCLKLSKDTLKVSFRGLISWSHAGGQQIAGSRVEKALIAEQVTSTGLPWLWSEAEEQVVPLLMEAKQRFSATQIVFGDGPGSLTVQYHQNLAEKAGLEAVFPLRDSSAEILRDELLEAGVRSVITAIDTSKLPRALIGRTYSESLFADLPEGADLWGADGSFHTFVCGGPMLAKPISPQLLDLQVEENWALAKLGPGTRRSYADRPVARVHPKKHK